jgi:glyoxylase I family protein
VRVTGFHHLAVQVKDLERTAHFYRDVLGLAESKRHHRDDGSLRSIWLDLPGGGFFALEEVAEAPRPEPFKSERAGMLLVALRIGAADRAGAVAELARHGIPLEHQTRWTLYVRDPEGNRVALSHHPEDPV